MIVFILGQTVKPVQFYHQLDVFLNSSSGNRFSKDIKWNENREEILVRDTLISSNVRGFRPFLCGGAAGEHSLCMQGNTNDVALQ